jgi:hypothetical protein
MPNRPTKSATRKPKAPRKAKPVRERPATVAGEAFVYQMVWNGLPRNEAAQAAGISVDYARRLLKSPDVMAIYQRELAALRESGKARAFHRAEELSQQDDNLTAAGAAVKLILSYGDERGASPTININLTPGYVIDPTRAFEKRNAPKIIDNSSAEIVVAAQPLPTADADDPSPSSTAPTRGHTGGTYVNSSGHVVRSPKCAPGHIEGATAHCRDGAESFSEHHRGTCSGHGGVAKWYR